MRLRGSSLVSLASRLPRLRWHRRPHSQFTLRRDFVVLPGSRGYVSAYYMLELRTMSTLRDALHRSNVVENH